MKMDILDDVPIGIQTVLIDKPAIRHHGPIDCQTLKAWREILRHSLIKKSVHGSPEGNATHLILVPVLMYLHL